MAEQAHTETEQNQTDMERTDDKETFRRAQAVVAALTARHWHISFAESCTAGLAAAKLVDVPSASAVFDASFVTYANEAKVQYLGVDPAAIKAYGVVSEPVAGQMAKGCADRNHAEVGVGISGIAGPTGGTPEKPVGTVCFGFCHDGNTETCTRHFGSIGRAEVRAASVRFVYEKLCEILE